MCSSIDLGCEFVTISVNQISPHLVICCGIYIINVKYTVYIIMGGSGWWILVWFVWAVTTAGAVWVSAIR